MPTAISLVDLAKDMHQNNRQHGWYDDRDHEDETRESMTALTHSEVSEALECARSKNPLDMQLRYEGKHGNTYPDPNVGHSTADLGHVLKPVGFPSELADTVIRALDFGVWFGVPLVEPMRNRLRPGEPEKMTARWCAAALSRIHTAVTNEDINDVVQQCYDLAALYDFDMDEVIIIKHEYNKTRARRHGGKKI